MNVQKSDAVRGREPDGRRSELHARVSTSASPDSLLSLPFDRSSSAHGSNQRRYTAQSISLLVYVGLGVGTGRGMRVWPAALRPVRRHRRANAAIWLLEACAPNF